MLAVCRGAAQAASIDYPRLVYPYLEKEMSLATPIPVQRLCVLAQVSRAGLYRWRQAPPTVDADLDLRDAIQKIPLEWPSYRWRRMARAVCSKRSLPLRETAGMSPLGAALGLWGQAEEFGSLS